MDYFIRHKIIKNEEDESYTLVLYTNQNLYEFAQEFFNSEEDTKKTFENKILNYIKENLPDIKVNTIKIMAGTLLVASIPFVSINAKAEQVNSYSNIQSYNNYTYRVEPGDTLYKISMKFNTSIEQLKVMNNLTSDNILIGQQLKIPQTNGQYKVKAGDTLYKIANQFNTSVDYIKSINNLNSDLIYPGQVLIINEPYYLNYIVKRGDYLYKIAIQFNSSIEQIKELNNLNSNMIYTGQSLKIPIQESSTLISDSSSLMVVVNKNNRLHEDYIPPDLSVPNIPFTFDEYSSKKLMRKEAKEAIERLFDRAKKDNIHLLALSGYRSYSHQEYIFTSKVMERGIERANQTSAYPGQSEHQTGLAMDVTSPSANYMLTQYFGDTKEGKWLKQNASDFGFIIRYPKGKEDITGYSYEPWHIRYVGIEAAKTIDQQNITLEEYRSIY